MVGHDGCVSLVERHSAAGQLLLPVRRLRSTATMDVTTESELRGAVTKPLDYRCSIYQDSSVTRSRPLPAASLHVVLALLDGELHGYALMRRVEELSDGAVRMGPGTLYGTLTRLVDETLIVETTDKSARGDNERRRYYELTPNGRVVAVDELARLHALVHRTASHLPGGAPA
jgi:DNA-binding PadR family transcriptional regulator